MEYIKRQSEKILAKSLKSDKIIIILGARQVGKTTLAKRRLSGKESLFLNLDIDSDRQKWQAAAALPPAEAWRFLGQSRFLIIDEAQRWPQTGRIVKGWYDAGVKAKMVLLGSSSLDILNQAAESLAGRNEKIYLPPLLFAEIVANQEWSSSEASADFLQQNFPAQISGLLSSLMLYGAYPEAVTTTDKKKYLLNLSSDYLFKDVLQLGLVKTPDLIKRLLALLAHQVGAEVSVNELSLNLGMARQTVERYLELLEQTFVIFSLPSFSTNPRKEIAKRRKYYFWDTGIRNAVLNDFSAVPDRGDLGALWENWVIAEFAKRNMLSGRQQELFFWRSRAGSEVDLVVREDNQLRAFEIKWSKNKAITRAFSDKYKVKVDLINKDVFYPFISGLEQDLPLLNG